MAFQTYDGELTPEQAKARLLDWAAAHDEQRRGSLGPMLAKAAVFVAVGAVATRVLGGGSGRRSDGRPRPGSRLASLALLAPIARFAMPFAIRAVTAWATQPKPSQSPNSTSPAPSSVL